MNNWKAVEKPIFVDEDPFIFGFILAVKDFFIHTLNQHKITKEEEKNL